MLNPNWMLDAITWKCNQLGISYGKFVGQCSKSELNRIYTEYAEMLKAKEKRQSTQLSEKQAREDSGK